MAAQYAIMRFKKYKGPEISPIEAHNERTKESYASNPDIDTSRSHLNFHLIEPQGRYRTEAEKQIAEAGCRTRKDSIRLVEVLFTASPEFFQGKKKKDVKEFFQEALSFWKAGRIRIRLFQQWCIWTRKLPICTFLCPADRGWKAKCKGYRRE